MVSSQPSAGGGGGLRVGSECLLPSWPSWLCAGAGAWEAGRGGRVRGNPSHWGSGAFRAPVCLLAAFFLPESQVSFRPSLRTGASPRHRAGCPRTGASGVVLLMRGGQGGSRCPCSCAHLGTCAHVGNAALGPQRRDQLPSVCWVRDALSRPRART